MKRIGKYALYLIASIAAICFIVFVCVPLILGKHFASFDEVYWYNARYPTEISFFRDEASTLMATTEDVRYGASPLRPMESVADTSLVIQEEAAAFRKFELNKWKVFRFQLFTRSSYPGTTRTARCIPHYRDILVFKKRNKTTGVALICFECQKQQIMSVENGEIDFDHFFDYGRLQFLLNRW